MHIIYKNLYETPLEAIERFRKEALISPYIPMTYAGRLDPMAEGLLVCLVGEECKDKGKYLSLTKEYEFEILVGVATDTFDLLGLIKNVQYKQIVSATMIKENMSKMTGTFMQQYPAFSSKPINGVPRFVHAKNGYIHPTTHEVTLHHFSVNEIRTVTGVKLLSKVDESTRNVQGDFRQKEIYASWHDTLQPEEMFQIISCVTTVSSGFYIRQLVKDISDALNIPMTTFWIRRTKIGEYSLPNK